MTGGLAIATADYPAGFVPESLAEFGQHDERQGVPMRGPIATALVIAAFGAMLAACAGTGPSPTANATSNATPSAPAVAHPTGLPATPATLPSFHADEPLLLVAKRGDLGGGIFVMQPDGSRITQLATDALPGLHKRPDWSPDGRRVVFIDETTERMWIANLDGSPSESLAACDKPGCDLPGWSPDGKRIAFSRVESADGVVGPAAVGIYVVELATGNVTLVVRLERPLLADAPRWSPDGTQIVFQVERMDAEAYDTGAAIAVVPATGGEARYLTNFDLFASAPDWGWVTNEIVFSVELAGAKRDPDPRATFDLWAIRPDGSKLRQITNLAEGRRLLVPRWTPDGTRLVSKEYEGTDYGGGRLVDPVSGSVDLFVTDLIYSRPLIRPLP
jgi:Tol biopolymer transport system component